MLKLFGPLVLLIASACPAAWAEQGSDCWAGKRQTDLRTGQVEFKCITYAEIPSAFLKKSRLGQIAASGFAGPNDTHFVVESLKDEDWDVRVEAARTLGLIGQADAAPQLADAITLNDWRLTFEAMNSLARLKHGRLIWY